MAFFHVEFTQVSIVEIPDRMMKGFYNDDTGELMVSDSLVALVKFIPEGVPRDFAINQNYPNPFNISTIIPYKLEKDARIEIALYNTRGQRVITLVNQNLLAGCHQITWSGVNEDGFSVSSGVYILQIKE